MRLLLVLRLLALLTAANAAPVLVARVLNDRFAMPVDGRYRFVDGHPIFGRTKTIRGVVASIVLTIAMAPVVGMTPTTGLIIALAAMTGDLISSFLKRRLGMDSSSQAFGLDQIPESLLPLLAVRHFCSLSAGEIAAGVGLFLIGELVLSRLLYAIHLRDRPY